MNDEQLKQAIELIKAGRKSEGAILLKQYLQANPGSENGWLWMAACADGYAQKQESLQKAIEINPGNSLAREALAKIEAANKPSLDNILSTTAAPPEAPSVRATATTPPSDLIPAVCPNCGGKLQLNPNAETTTCQYCGTEHIIRHNQSGAVMLEAFARCPVCNRNDRAEKVSAIIHNQTTQSKGIVPQQRIVTDGRGRAHTQNVNVSVETTQISELARRLTPPPAPPNKPPRSSIIVLLIMAIIFFAIGLCSIIYLSGTSSQNSSPVCGVIFFLLSIILFGLWLYLSRSKKRREAMNKKRVEAASKYQRWQQAMARWEKLYYCGRDDVVFIPGEKTSSQLEKMINYLYNLPPK